MDAREEKALEALKDFDSYANVTLAIARCPDGCGATLVDVYRVDYTADQPFTPVVQGAGRDVSEALTAAHVQLRVLLKSVETRNAEVANLEAMFNLPSAEADNA